MLCQYNCCLYYVLAKKSPVTLLCLSVCLSVSVYLSLLKEENSNSDQPIIHSHSQKFPNDIENGGWTVLVPRLLRKSLKIHNVLANGLPQVYKR